MNLWFWHSACCPMLVKYLYEGYENILKSLKVIKRIGQSLQWYRLEISSFSNLSHSLSYFGTRKPSSNFSTLQIGVSLRLTNYSNWDSCLTWFMGVKNSQMCIQPNTSPRLEIIASWGPLPISVVLWSERSLKSKMLSLARTSKVVNNISV